MTVADLNHSIDNRLRLLRQTAFTVLFSYYLLVLHSITFSLYYIVFFLNIQRKIFAWRLLVIDENGLAAENALNEYANIKLDLAFYDERSPSRCGDVVEKIKVPFVVGDQFGRGSQEGKHRRNLYCFTDGCFTPNSSFLAMMSDTTVDTYIVPDFLYLQ